MQPVSRKKNSKMKKRRQRRNPLSKILGGLFAIILIVALSAGMTALLPKQDYAAMTAAAAPTEAPTPEPDPTISPTPALYAPFGAQYGHGGEHLIPETPTPSPSPIPTKAPTPTPTAQPQPTAVTYTTLRKGSNGPSVKNLQQALIDLGYLTDKADGNFGSNTHNAVVQFQAVNGLAADGLAGNQTQTLLFSGSALPASEAPEMDYLILVNRTNKLDKHFAPTDLVKIEEGDTVILSASPIPGNEKLVARVIDMLYRLGARVISGSANGVHTSGHACREELKMMLNLVKPKYFIPAHGEYRMLVKHKQLAVEVGIPEENVFIAENGSVIELNEFQGAITGKVQAGRVLIDGLGVGDVGNIVLRDRKQLSQDGILIVVVTLDRETRTIAAGPDIVSRGFVYVREADELMAGAREKVTQSLEKSLERNIVDWSSLKTGLRDTLSRYLYEKTRRRPMILPIIQEI